MRVKVELEIEVTTDWTEIENCTAENFQDHIRYVLNDMYTADNAGDIDYVSQVVSITFPDNAISLKGEPI